MPAPIQNKKYHSREDFLQDVSLIVENSATYNGEDDIYTKSAERLREVVIQRLQDNDEKLMKLEKAINPLLDDNRQVITDSGSRFCVLASIALPSR